MSQISTLSSFGKEIFDLTDSAIGRELAELHALRIQRRKLQVIYTQVLP
jgi:arginine repressor